MRGRLARTGIATLLFAPAMAIVAWRAIGPEWVPSVAVSAAVLTPPLWWLLTERTESCATWRAAASGALIGASTQIAPWIFKVAAYELQHWSHHVGDAGLAGLWGPVLFIFAVGSSIAGALVGATLGLTVRRFWRT